MNEVSKGMRERIEKAIADQQATEARQQTERRQLKLQEQQEAAKQRADQAKIARTKSLMAEIIRASAIEAAEILAEKGRTPKLAYGEMVDKTGLWSSLLNRARQYEFRPLLNAWPLTKVETFEVYQHYDNWSGKEGDGWSTHSRLLGYTGVALGTTGELLRVETTILSHPQEDQFYWLLGDELSEDQLVDSKTITPEDIQYPERSKRVEAWKNVLSVVCGGVLLKGEAEPQDIQLVK